MTSALTIGIAATGLLLAACLALLVALDREPGGVLLGGLALLETALVAQVVAAAVLVIRGERPASPVVFAAYLLGALLLLPIGVLWAAAERSRWAAGVLAVAALAVPAIELRLVHLWGGGVG